MSPVHRLSQMGSMTTNKIDYPSMLAGYGDFGAMTRIQYTSLGSNGSISFNSIPQTFQDLIVVCSVRSTHTSTDSLYAAFPYNSNTFSSTSLSGDGSSASSSRTQNGFGSRAGDIPISTSTSGIFGSALIHIPNYANTSTFKTALMRVASDLNGSGTTWLSVGLNRATAAVTGITLFSGNANLLAGSTAALYGVRSSAS